MKIAVCLSGHMRTWEHCFPNFEKYIMNVYSPDIYIHTWKTTGNSYLGIPDKDTFFVKYGFDRTYEIIDIENIKKLYSPIKLEIEDYDEIEDKIKEESNFIDITRRGALDSPVETLLSFYRKRYLCNTLIKDNSYDIVILSRPDIIHRSKFVIDEDYTSTIITPLEQSWWGLSDIFAYSTQKNINIYCDLYHNLQRIQETTDVAMNSHMILDKWLDINNMPVKKNNIDIKLMKIRDGIPYMHYEKSKSWK